LDKILYLEDDPLLAKSVIKFLEKHNYKLEWVRDGSEAIDATYERSYALYLFDINVPQIQGDDLLLSLREAGDTTPTILISALVDIESVTKGFRSGADDYIKKPFNPQELLVRIESKTAHFTKTIGYKNYRVSPDDEKIYHNDKEIFLSNLHKNIFIALIKNYPNPVTKEELLLFLDSPTDIALRVNITKLKTKVDVEIENVRGVGYKLA